MSTASRSPMYGDNIDMDLNQELSIIRCCSYKSGVPNCPFSPWLMFLTICDESCVCLPALVHATLVFCTECTPIHGPCEQANPESGRCESCTEVE